MCEEMLEKIVCSTALNIAFSARLKMTIMYSHTDTDSQICALASTMYIKQRSTHILSLRQFLINALVAIVA